LDNRALRRGQSLINRGDDNRSFAGVEIDDIFESFPLLVDRLPLLFEAIFKYLQCNIKCKPDQSNFTTMRVYYHNFNKPVLLT